MTLRIVTFLLAFLLTVPARAQQDPAPAPAELTIWNRPIVTFRATVAGATPEQRMRNAEQRIYEHTRDKRAPPVTTHETTFAGITGVVVVAGDDVAFGLVPADLDAESRSTVSQAATQAAERLSAALLAQELQRRPEILARGIGLTTLTAIAFVIAIRLILALRRVGIRKMDAFLRCRRLTIGGVDIVPTLETVERATFRVLSWAAIGAVSYLALTVILNLFPYTEPLGERLGDYLVGLITNAVSVVIRAMPRMVAVIAVLMITRAIALWVSRLLAEVEQGVRVVTWLAREQARATRRLANGLVWLLGIATAYSLLPWAGSRVFQGTSLVLGLGASLASTGLVTQWVSGIVILYSRSFRIGDFVRIGDVEGFVREMGALATKLSTMRREEVTIPNAVVTAERLTNFTRLGGEHGALLSIAICIGYDVPWQQVKDLLLQAASITPGVRANPAPSVLQWELNDFCVQHLLHVHLERSEDRVQVRSELNSRILDTFTAAGVQIMTPHYEAQPERPVIATSLPGR